MKNKISQLTELLKQSTNIVFFGGAGVSTASGIPDFRSSNGLFNEKLNCTFTPEQLVSHTFYKKYPELFFEFYRNKLIYPDVTPNSCHTSLAKLEQIGKLKAVITQNIDGLHQMAGNTKVYELHGSVHRNYCTQCHTFYDVDFILNSSGIPTCPRCDGRVKPDVVLYEESLDDMTLMQSIKAISQADTLIIGGTSLVVYPAAGLINYFKGRHLILINKSTTSADEKADLVIHDSIDYVLSEAIKQL